MVTYSCPACFKVYDKFEDLDIHRRTVHGRDAHGNLVIDARTPLMRIEALEAKIAAVYAEIVTLRTEMEKRP